MRVNRIEAAIPGLRLCQVSLIALISLLMLGCSGGGNSPSAVGTAPPTTPTNTSDSGCNGSCASASSFLSTAQVQTVINQAVAEAKAQNVPATIAVVDRVGNVLAVYRMSGARNTVTITSNRGVIGGLENLTVPSELAAIAKALTGAYLSSEGNAFSTRTASQIIQEHFNPGEANTPAGPLFGVQFSQLPCSDFSTRFTTGTGIGPRRSPLGLSADPGGFPLYLAGTPVGGVGVVADAQYSLDLNIFDLDRNSDELIATAATFNFAAPLDRRGDRITADGKTFRFSDVGFTDLTSSPANAPAATAADGALIRVPAYFDGAILPGVAFAQAASGIRADTGALNDLDAFILVNAANANRYPIIAGTGAGALTAAEVQELIRQALMIANKARAQIRKPTDSQARVSVSIVDITGKALAIARSRDAPIFGTDVSLQKARTAAFYSSANAAADLQGQADARYLGATVSATNAALTTVALSSVGQYVTRARSFLGSSTALGDGAFAFSDRAGGNLSRPFYPDGIEGLPPGPFSYPFAQWSVFKDGLQLDLVYNGVAGHLAHYLNQAGLSLTLDGNPLAPAPTPANLIPVPDVGNSCSSITRIANGIQIFPGSVPIYRGNVLIGGIGVSGDGVDQDDMIAFLGLHNAGAALNGAIGNAPINMRADQLTPQGTRLRYVQCPQAPFLNSNEQNVCGGK